MNNLNLKSKKGFTLIELLVVIGILAVLAAIAIPSVAGLIDRANVSSDSTNANEMTNAIERFTSEYELYCQDLASGKVDINNLDAAQGRVYNVTGVIDRTGVENLEKDATAGVDTTGKAIYRDTKYPVNAETMQAVVENYMKTSSTTFTPKQSDCNYYYSPDCGLIVCAETTESDVDDLNKLVQSGKDAKGNILGPSTKWINITYEAYLSAGDDTASEELPPPIINSNGFYYNQPYATEYDAQSALSIVFVFRENGIANVFSTNEDGSMGSIAIEYTYNNNMLYVGNDEMGILELAILNDGTQLNFDGMILTCDNEFLCADDEYFYAMSQDDAGKDICMAFAMDCNATSYNETLTTVHGKEVVLWGTYMTAPNVETVRIADGIKHLEVTFYGCTNLKTVYIPNSVNTIKGAFAGCSNLETIHYDGTMAEWANLNRVAAVPDGVTVICTNGVF